MPRRKFQRPEVYSWKGKSGEKFWKAEWRQYIEGRPKPKHRAMTWPCSEYTKSEAQEQCDRTVREETGGTLRPDGSLTVKNFWEQIHFPTLSLRVAANTKSSYERLWRNFIEPAIGKTELQHVTKSAIDAILNKMALAGKSDMTLKILQSIVHAMFVEAVENGYIARNPAHRVTLPRGKAAKQTRALSEAEARKIFDLPVSRGSLMFRVMLTTGARIGEVLAFTKADLTTDGLVIDESALRGKPSSTKNGRARRVPLPPMLTEELGQWAKQTPGNLLFPNSVGNMDRQGSIAVCKLVKDLRTATGIADLTARMCRTTFATLFQSDPRDLQDILGHSTVNLTMEVYRKPITARQRAAVEELEARLRGKVVAMPIRESA